jgi:hypothetical protein
MTKILTRSLAIAATLTLGVGAFATAARADVVRVYAQPTRLLLPTTTVVHPGFTVRSTRRTILPAPPATVTTRTYELPAVIHDVTDGAATTTTTTPATVISPSSVVVPTGTVTSTSTVTETKVAEPDPLGRLRAMGDQISLGVSKGLLNTATEASLRAEYSRLDALINADLVGGLTTAENNDLEQQLTIFQQTISNAMK